MSEEPSAPIPKSPRRLCLWGRRDRGYKPQIQPRAEATVRRCTPGEIPSGKFAHPFFWKKFKVWVDGVILSKTRRFYSRVKPRILSSKVTPPDQRGWWSIRCEEYIRTSTSIVLLRTYDSHLILHHPLWSGGVKMRKFGRTASLMRKRRSPARYHRREPRPSSSGRTEHILSGH